MAKSKPVDLSAAQTCSDFHIEFDGLDSVDGSDAVIRFRVVTEESEGDQPKIGLDFLIEAKNDGVEGMIRRGYAELINALRQMLWEADVQRKGYTRE